MPACTRSPPPPPLTALTHVRAALAARDGLAHTNFTVTAAGAVVRADARFEALAWVAGAGTQLPATTLAMLAPSLLVALRRRPPGAPRSTHDVWVDGGALRIRYWLFTGATPALTDVSMYLYLADAADPAPCPRAHFGSR
ncbi:MAG: hypothetical protein IPH44_15045 [Myxococcales bacterium]|nr:hypothetical protein [Myxococcales bacterium]MBP6847103.1 hypothetical protein [Kofleriaceae bacterium]